MKPNKLSSRRKEKLRNVVHVAMATAACDVETLYDDVMAGIAE